MITNGKMTTLAQQNIQRKSNNDTIDAKSHRATFQGDDTESSEITTTNKHNSHQLQGNGTESTVQPAKLRQNKRHKTSGKAAKQLIQSKWHGKQNKANSKASG